LLNIVSPNKAENLSPIPIHHYLLNLALLISLALSPVRLPAHLVDLESIMDSQLHLYFRSMSVLEPAAVVVDERIVLESSLVLD
jgi:hypothetical protein